MYDIQVADVPEFTVAGVIVHNCWWACHDLFPDLMGQEWTPSAITVGGESRTSPLAGLR